MSSRTAIVVVTYEPEPSALFHLLEQVDSQARTVYLVDNASHNISTWLPALPGSNVEVIRLASNLGIAAALNRGFEAASAAGNAEFCALFDQDSEPSSDMIAKLERHYDNLSSHGPVAQIGPYFFEHNRGYYLPFIEFKHGFPRRKRDPGNGSVTKADYLISSGALVSLAALEAVGLMDETLFIDYVDIEWGLRARTAGFQSYGAYDVRMEHTIGDDTLQVAGVRLAVHKPIRRYYYYRNALLLCRRHYVPVAWKVHEVARLTLKFVIFALLSRHRAANTRMMLKGIRDGLAGKAGKFAE